MKIGRKVQHGYNTRLSGKTKEYSAWDHMKQRCSNPKDKRYAHYGARGIAVCERWLIFENFLEDMGLAPSPKHSLDRIENDKGYYKENCRWATNSEQLRNTRTNVFLEYKGERLTLIEWCERLNINHQLLSRRIKSGWETERALTTPSRKKR